MELSKTIALFRMEILTVFSVVSKAIVIKEFFTTLPKVFCTL